MTRLEQARRTIARLRQELRNEHGALRNVLKTNREQLAWIKWADRRMAKLEREAYHGEQL